MAAIVVKSRGSLRVASTRNCPYRHASAAERITVYQKRDIGPRVEQPLPTWPSPPCLHTSLWCLHWCNDDQRYWLAAYKPYAKCLVSRGISETRFWPRQHNTLSYNRNRTIRLCLTTVMVPRTAARTTPGKMISIYSLIEEPCTVESGDVYSALTSSCPRKRKGCLTLVFLVTRISPTCERTLVHIMLRCGLPLTSPAQILVST